MGKNSGKKYDLEDRTYLFTKNVIVYIEKLPRSHPNIEIGKQLMRSAGSVGANYIEANESLSKKDFLMRIKICRKEANNKILVAPIKIGYFIFKRSLWSMCVILCVY